ncbi:hypothetical protein C8R44DRAFT_783205 [Mycena epipterygia]|nr:hypothetical protein C8R44DRAFT_783205 [Mycena epipterygia]
MFSCIFGTRAPQIHLTGPPRLPEDLEREIFEITAFQDPASLPQLLRVARRTLLWLEPHLYGVIVILDDTSMLTRMRDRIKRKPAAVWRDGPRHLFLCIHSDAAFAAEILTKCTSLENLMLYCDPEQPRQFLPQLEAMPRLRRLGIDMHDFFGPTIGSPGGIDLSGPAFAGLTHLLLMDSELDAVVEVWCTQLALLPRLTHLALVDDAPGATITAILARFPALHVLVSLRQDFRRYTLESLVRRMGIVDVRFVCLFFMSFTDDWETGARGGEDFWVRADSFVAAKRRGEIEATTYWLGDDPLI